MRTVRVGILCPHELFASFYNHGNGEFFFMFMSGLPGVTWARILGNCLSTKALEEYWSHNEDLKHILRHELAEAHLIISECKEARTRT